MVYHVFAENAMILFPYMSCRYPVSLKVTPNAQFVPDIVSYHPTEYLLPLLIELRTANAMQFHEPLSSCPLCIVHQLAGEYIVVESHWPAFEPVW